MSESDDPADSIARLRQDYQQLLQAMERNTSRFRLLARSVLRIQEDERRRLARDLHDGLGQNLTALKHRLAQLAERIGEQHPEWSTQLQACHALCADTLAETRALSRLLRPQVLDDLGLEAALRWLARMLSESSSTAIEVEVQPLPTLDGELQTLIYRIAQESLNNVLRHAGAEHAVLRLDVHGDRLRLSIWDDGCGFDVAAAMSLASGGAHAGLAGMRERIALHGGTLRIDSRAEQGTHVRVLLPLDESAGTLSP